jgi:hypothetical protein
MQGFCVADGNEAQRVSGLARWTPFSCATIGALGLGVGSNVLGIGMAICPCALAAAAGLWLGSGWFFIGLGILTFTGGISVRSIYDRLYNAIIRPILRTEAIPKHGPPRRFGCAIGGVMYVMSGVGFLLHVGWLAFAPAALMVVLAGIAGITHWCFASAVYNLLFPGRNAARLT